MVPFRKIWQYLVGGASGGCDVGGDVGHHRRTYRTCSVGGQSGPDSEGGGVPNPPRVAALSGFEHLCGTLTSRTRGCGCSPAIWTSSQRASPEENRSIRNAIREIACAQLGLCIGQRDPRVTVFGSRQRECSPPPLFTFVNQKGDRLFAGQHVASAVERRPGVRNHQLVVMLRRSQPEATIGVKT